MVAQGGQETVGEATYIVLRPECPGRQATSDVLEIGKGGTAGNFPVLLLLLLFSTSFTPPPFTALPVSKGPPHVSCLWHIHFIADVH